MVITIIAALLMASSITLFSVLLTFPLAMKLGLIDRPGQRKHHHGNVPLTGGIAMFMGISSASLTLIPFSPQHAAWLLASLVVVIMGVVDDSKGLSAGFRLGVQTGLTLILSIAGGLYLENFGNLLNLGEIHLPYLGYLITILAVSGAINAFNMIDGIDGLAGCSALVSFSGLAILFSAHSNSYGLQLTTIFLGALLPYLIANLTLPPFKQKIFMGDAGSMLLGLTIVWLLVHGSQGDTPSFRPVVALWLIAVPLMDMTSTMLRRIQYKRSPFAPDRNHLHHILMRKGLTPHQTLTVITMLSIAMACIGITGERFLTPEWVMFGSFILLFFIYHHVMRQFLPEFNPPVLPQAQ